MGGLAHELGHALGLPHPPGCDEGLPTCDHPALMANGYEAYPDTYLRDDEKAILRSSPFITPLPTPLPPLVDLSPAIRGVIVDPDGRTRERRVVRGFAGHRGSNRTGRHVRHTRTRRLLPSRRVRSPGEYLRGYYNGEGITTSPDEAFWVTVEGTDIEGITIRLPALPQHLPSIEC